MRENWSNEREVKEVCSCDCRREKEETLFVRIPFPMLTPKGFPEEENTKECESDEEEMPRKHLTHDLPLGYERSGGIRFFEVVEVHHPEEVFSSENGEEEVHRPCGESKATSKCGKILLLPSKLEDRKCKKGKEDMNPRTLCKAEKES